MDFKVSEDTQSQYMVDPAPTSVAPSDLPESSLSEESVLDELLGEPLEMVNEVKVPRSPGRPKGKESVPQYASIIEANGGDRLDNPCHGQREPYYNNKREQPQHRHIGLLKAQGLTNKEIAEETGYTPVAVSNILRQPWIQDLIYQEMRRAGRDAVRETLEVQALPSIQKLIELRDDVEVYAKNPDIARKAANDLLDRVYGKPNQPITRTEKVELDSLTDQQLAEIVKNGKYSTN